MQGEEKVLELMEYIGSEIAYKRGRGTKSLIPVEKNIGVKDDDIKDIVGTLPNLHQYFSCSLQSKENLIQ